MLRGSDGSNILTPEKEEAFSDVRLREVEDSITDLTANESSVLEPSVADLQRQSVSDLVDRLLDRVEGPASRGEKGRGGATEQAGMMAADTGFYSRAQGFKEKALMIAEEMEREQRLSQRTQGKRDGEKGKGGRERRREKSRARRGAGFIGDASARGSYIEEQGVEEEGRAGGDRESASRAALMGGHFTDGEDVYESGGEEEEDYESEAPGEAEEDWEGEEEEDGFEDEDGWAEPGAGEQEGEFGRHGDEVPMVDRVYALVERVQGGSGADGMGRGDITISDIKGLFSFPMDKFQIQTVEAFLRGSSVVVAAPTSSGKTLVAEAAAAATIARGGKIVYTTPLKALSNQKLREFREKFGEGNVGLMTGDAAVNREAPILIMTTEILRNMLYAGMGEEEDSRLGGIDTVVLDEVHYLSDISRGTVWEETIIYCPPRVKLICLSATVANPDELAEWIESIHGPTELVTSARRPVPLRWHFSTRFGMQPLLNAQQTAINPRLLLAPEEEESEAEGDAEGDSVGFESFLKKGKSGGGRGTTRGGRRGGRGREPYEDMAGRMARGLRDKKRAGARGGASELARDELALYEDEMRARGRKGGNRGAKRELSPEDMKKLWRRQVPRVRDTLLQLQRHNMLPAIWFIFSRRGCDTAVTYVNDLQLLNPQEQEEMNEALREFHAQQPEAVRKGCAAALLRGVAAHHAGCLPAWKGFIEELYQRGLIKVSLLPGHHTTSLKVPSLRIQRIRKGSST